MTGHTDGRRAAIYCRISQKDKNIPKVENQEAQCRRLATANGYEVVAVFVDDGISGSNLGIERPGFVELQDFIEAGGCDYLLSVHEDRFTRAGAIENLKFSALCADNGVRKHTTRQGLEAEDPDIIEFMTFLNGWKARKEVRDNVRRRKDANAENRLAGIPSKTGPRPFGWNDDRVTINVPEAELIRSGTAAILAGRSLNSVLAAWRATDIRPSRASAWGRMSVRKVLCRWRNAGVVSHMDEPSDVIGQWDAIVSRGEVEQVRIIIDQGIGKLRTPSRLLSGVIKCSCGESMVASGANGKPTYQCSARLRGRAEPGQVHCAIMAHVIEPIVKRGVAGHFLINSGDESKPDAEVERLADLHRKRADLVDKLARVQDGYLDGLFTRGQASSRAAEINDAVAKADAAIEQLVSRSASARLTAETMKVLATREDDTTGRRQPQITTEGIVASFDNLPIEQARELVKATLRVTVTPGRGTDRIHLELLNDPGKSSRSPERGTRTISAKNRRKPE